jgi:hypothetical protein
MSRTLAILAAVALAGCSADPGVPVNNPGPDVASLAVLNAFPAGSGTVMTLDGASLALPASGSSTLASLTAGPHQLSAMSTAGATLASASFVLAAGDHRTAVLSGNAVHAVLLVTALDTAVIPVADGIKVRVVHTAPDAPGMDAYLFKTTEAADSASLFVTGFRYGSGTDPRFPGYGVRPPGTYDVWFKAAGTDQVLAQINNINLTAGGVYSVILAEDASGALQVRLVTEH